MIFHQRRLVVAINTALAAMVAGCSTPGENLQAVVDELRFEEGEKGCVRASANIDLAAAPFAEANATVTLVKTQGDSPPPC